MIRHLRALWADLAAIGDPFGVDTDWHHGLDHDQPDPEETP